MPSLLRYLSDSMGHGSQRVYIRLIKIGWLDEIKRLEVKK
ncbi:hypothetical protein ES708_26097 [subsurface metagenome]